MIILRSILREKKSAIIERWLNDILAEFEPGTSSFLNNKKDRFANPIGHSLRTGAQGIFENLLDGIDAESICGHLDEIIRSRAIQDFTPARAVSFIFTLKKSVRAVLGTTVRDRQLYDELAEFEADIDQAALFAFDIYTKCREKLCELRVDEIKRNVEAVMNRLYGRGSDSKPPADGSGVNSMCNNLQRGGDR